MLTAAVASPPYPPHISHGTRPRCGRFGCLGRTTSEIMPWAFPRKVRPITTTDLRVLRVLTLRVISRQRGNLALLGVKRTSCGSLGLQVLPFENVVAPGSMRTHGCAELVQI